MWNRDHGEGYSQIPMNDINSTPATQPGTPMNPPPQKPAVVASSSPPRRTELQQPLLAADSPMGAQPQHAYYPILPNGQSYAAPNAPPPAAEWNYRPLSGGAPPPPPSPAVNSGGPPASQNNGWSCLACTFENPGMDSRCRICSTERGASAPAQPQRAAPQVAQAAAPVPAPQQQPVAYRSVPQGAPVPSAPPAAAAPASNPAGSGLRSSNAEVRPHRDWYWCSCLTMLCCFIPAFPCALAAMMNAVRARSAAFYGDTPSARRFSKKAKKLIIFCIVFGIVVRIVFFHVLNESVSHEGYPRRCHGRWVFGPWHNCHRHGHGDHMDDGVGQPVDGDDFTWTGTTWTDVGEGGDEWGGDFTWPPMDPDDPMMNPDDPMINGGDHDGGGGDHGDGGWWWRPHGGRHGRHHGNGAGGEGHNPDEHLQRGHHGGGRHGHDGGHHGDEGHQPGGGEGGAGGVVGGHQPGDPGDDKPEPQPF